MYIFFKTTWHSILFYFLVTKTTKSMNRGARESKKYTYDINTNCLYSPYGLHVCIRLYSSITKKFDYKLDIPLYDKFFTCFS